MRTTPRLRLWVSILGTVAVFGLVAFLLRLNGPTPDVSGQEKEASVEVPGKGEWPLWGGTVQRNLVNTFDVGIPTDWNIAKGKEKNIKWSVDLGSKAYGGPIIAGGKIYVGTNNDSPRNPDVTGDKGILMCFDAATGNFLWQFISDKLPIGRVQDWPKEGICSAPVVEGDRIWFVSNQCKVICASTGGLAAGNRGMTDEKYKTKTDADVIWELDMIGKYGVFPHNLATCSPLIGQGPHRDLLYVITSNGVDKGHINIPSPKAPSFLCIDKNKGTVVWESNIPGTNIMHGQWSNPVYTVTKGKRQVIFPGGDGYLYGFNPGDGTVLWKFDCNPKSAVYKLGPAGTKNDFVNTPIVWQDKLYIGVGQDPEHSKGVGHLWCIDLVKALAKGATNTDHDVSPFSEKKDPAPKFDPKDKRNANSAMVWHYGGPDPAGDREYFFGRTLSTCSVHEGLCYTADYDGFFYCFDALTGQKLYEHELGADTWSSPYCVDGNVYLGNERGEMHIFKQGRAKQLVRVVKTPSPPATKIRATPVVVNGTMYMMTENPCRLWAIR